MNRTWRVRLLAAVYLTIVVSGLNFSGLSVSEAHGSDKNLSRLSARQLEQRRREIDDRLQVLANYNLRSGVGAIGYRSQTHLDAAHTEWIQIELEREFRVDEVVLVPCISRGIETGFSVDAFPLEFSIIGGIGEDEDGIVIATFDANDRILPRSAPLVIPAGGVKATWIRLEATTLSPRLFDGKHLLQLTEILVFSGAENVALRQLVKTSSDEPEGSPAWDAAFTVDGFMPYLMNSASGTKSLPFVSGVGIGDQPALTIDLEAARPISQINLHLVDQGDTVPQTFTGDFGIPGLLRVEGSDQQAFSDAKLLAEYHHISDYDAGPIIMRRFPETKCRYVRLTAIDPYLYSHGGRNGSRLGFAEIELLSNGINVAGGATVVADFESKQPMRSLSELTDGSNVYGGILPLREWLDQLAQRHELETERPRVVAELNRRYLRQQANLNRLIWLATLLTAGTLSVILVGWNFRHRAVIKARERIAADLHDELGANIHAIGLLSDLAQSTNSPEKLKTILVRIRELTERTGTAAAHCANMLESRGLYENLMEEMQRCSTRFMADLEHEITFEGEEFLKELKPRKRIDLYLFYQESLINIIRHSGATKATTQLVADRHKATLNVTDNGQGLSESSGNGIPPSLKRRARLLGGKVSVDHPEGGGTCIVLTLRINRF